MNFEDKKNPEPILSFSASPADRAEGFTLLTALVPYYDEHTSPMTTTEYDTQHNRLMMLRESPTADFWDTLWHVPDMQAQIELESQNTFYVGITKRFLPPGKKFRVLDGGCGRGGVVLSHARVGYDAYGIDFATQTIAQAKTAFPELDLRIGTVENLPFPDSYFDAYWSLGVIEHHFEGYQRILQEAKRVLSPHGYLFITFPYLNPLRKLKINLGSYPKSHAATSPTNFYQFILNYRHVLRDLESLGFTLRYHRAVDGMKGVSDELPAARPVLASIGRSKNRLVQLAGTAFSEASAPLAGHIMLLALQRTS